MPIFCWWHGPEGAIYVRAVLAVDDLFWDFSDILGGIVATDCKPGFGAQSGAAKSTLRQFGATFVTTTKIIRPSCRQYL